MDSEDKFYIYLILAVFAVALVILSPVILYQFSGQKDKVVVERIITLPNQQQPTHGSGLPPTASSSSSSNDVYIPNSNVYDDARPNSAGINDAGINN